jgi:hypothetical protein
MFHKVFISYAKEDYRYALELFDYLKTHSYEPWLDKKSLLPGSNWDLEIKRALKNSDFIILLLSSTSVSKRGYVQKEYKLAMQYWEQKLEDDIYIIPLLINDCLVPESLNRFQWVKYDEEQAFSSIVSSLDLQRKILFKQKVGETDVVPQIQTKLLRYEFTSYDILIINLLSKGVLQKEIPAYLQANKIRPSSLSSLEKRLNFIKEIYSFSKNEQLVAFCKDMRLI